MQTEEERVRLLGLGKDGSMFCFDLSHAEGQHGAELLAGVFPEVAAALRTRPNNLHYLLVLFANSAPEIGVMLIDSSGLPEAVNAMTKQSQKFGQVFAIVIAPRSDKIASLFAPSMGTAGTA